MTWKSYILLAEMCVDAVVKTHFSSEALQNNTEVEVESSPAANIFVCNSFADKAVPATEKHGS